MNNHVALITGASRGIGREIAFRLARDGISIAVCYRNNELKAIEVVNEIIAAGGVAMPTYLELAERETIRGAVKSISSKLGPVTILINNGAIAQEKTFLEISDNDWEEMLKVNLQGPFACIQEVLPSMIGKGWGRIVNIVSIGAQWGGTNQIHYASAKAGLIGLTRSVAKTFAGTGVTCNAISPGLVSTDMSASELMSRSGQLKVEKIPAGRVGSTTDIADAAAYLVSESASYINGQTLNINGGMYFS